MTFLLCFYYYLSIHTCKYIYIRIYIGTKPIHWNHKYLFTSVVQPARIHLWFSGPMVWAGPIPLAPLDVGCSHEKPASRTRQISSDSCFVTVLYPVKLPISACVCWDVFCFCSHLSPQFISFRRLYADVCIPIEVLESPVGKAHLSILTVEGARVLGLQRRSIGDLYRAWYSIAICYGILVGYIHSNMDVHINILHIIYIYI